ncbi:hypothetical protein EQ832_01530 [Pseudomonas sp. ALS1131]|nr:hypothetical protein [Pseudomonas sp. ALS1131]TRO41723.1 hypothetical protein EQ832_01530 [Pseudomonas sp. ALS1131]
MITVYLWSGQGIYCGSVDVDPRSAMPRRSTLTAPPAISGEQVAQWTGTGWRVLDAPPPAPVPTSPAVPRTVSMRQARRALLDAGILAAVDASIAGMPGEDGQRARIDWEYATEVDRTWPLIGYMAEQLGLSEVQVDALFVSAARI